MEASTLFINGVIQKNTLLRIPYFQRRYVWKEDNWNRFAIDMESTLDSERNYFLGALILKEDTVTKADKMLGIGKKQLVIDGQQRLTTLCIFMKVLHMMVAKNDDFANQYLQTTNEQSPVLIHSRDDIAPFSKIMTLDTPKEVVDQSNIVKAYDYFLKYLSARKKEGVNLEALLNTINSSVTFVVISLKNEDDEQQIFDTINSLGVPLTTGELLKNFLYEENDEEAYRTNWRTMFDTDEAREFWEADSSKSRQSKTNKENRTIERFFHAFVRIKMWDFKNQLTDAQRKEFVKMENVFTTCKAFVNTFGMEKQDLANEIIDYAKLFKENLNDGILETRIPQHACIKRISCFINATKNYAVIPYVLYILHEVKDENERNRIFDYLESYLIRRVLAGSKNNNYSDLFTENLISNRIKSFEKFKKWIDEREDSSLALPQLSKVKLGMTTNTIDDISSRIVFYLYETKLNKTSEPNALDGGFNDYYTDGLMPKLAKTKDSPNWPRYRQDSAKEEKRQMLIGTLGNFFLLENGGKKDMRKNLDALCGIKVGIMTKWADKIRSSKNMLQNLTSWTEDDIKRRNDELARIFCENIWTV